MKVHLGRLGAGLVAGVVALALLSPPAGANTVTATTTEGAGLSFYNADGDPLNQITANTCGNPEWGPATVTASGTGTGGTIGVTIPLAGFGQVSGYRYALDLTLQLNGTYNSAGQVSFTGELTGTSTRFSASCVPSHTPCTISSTDLLGSGPMTAPNRPTLVTGDQLDLVGSNYSDSTVVTGSAGACAGWLPYNGGSVVLSTELTVD
jgi:hypothetical protein